MDTVDVDPAELDELSSDLVVYAARLIRAVRRAHPQPAGIRTLSLLDELGPLGVTALAEADHCSQPTMTGTVKQLVERGWVERRAHPDDARASLIALTPAGSAALAEVRAANAHLVADRITSHPTHTATELATAVAVLRDLLDRPSTEEPPHRPDDTGGTP